jgi:hypothetical protein
VLSAATFPQPYRPFAFRFERGQTVPIWVLSIIASLALAFFILNYANTVRWQVRAQNAADSAAAAALGGDAARLNSVQLLLAAFDIQQLRVRDALGAVPTLIGANNCKNTVISSGCATQLSNAVTDLTTQINNLQNINTTLDNFSSKTLTDTLVTPQTTVASFFAPNGSNGCALNLLTDCDFQYTTRIAMSSSGMPVVDEYACKKVPNFVAGFMHITGSQANYYAIGHTTETLSPLSTVYTPSSLGSALTTTGSVFPSVSGNTQVYSLLGLSINTGSYIPTATSLPKSLDPEAISAVCPS